MASTARSSTRSSASRRRSSAILSRILARLHPGRAASREATILIASGRCPQARMRSYAASRSAATLGSPTTLTSSSIASSGGMTSRSTWWAPDRPVSLALLVTSTAQPAAPGSSGRTWAVLAALSSTTSTRRSARVER